jgi:hypothetical protein
VTQAYLERMEAHDTKDAGENGAEHQGLELHKRARMLEPNICPIATNTPHCPDTWLPAPTATGIILARLLGLMPSARRLHMGARLHR